MIARRTAFFLADFHGHPNPEWPQRLEIEQPGLRVTPDGNPQVVDHDCSFAIVAGTEAYTEGMTATVRITRASSGIAHAVASA